MLTDQPPGMPLNGQAAIFYGVVGVGLIIASDYAPTLVNGLLALILVGLILRHTGAFDQFISSGVAATSHQQR